MLDPANFVSVIDNPYYPLPVGRVLVYKGVRDGRKQIDTVTVTDRTRVLEGITATTITDVAKTPTGKLLEKTKDWYAQDKQGNVWYLGEDTAAYLPNGQVDTSGSWMAGINDGEPGIIMEADPQIPNPKSACDPVFADRAQRWGPSALLLVVVWIVIALVVAAMIDYFEATSDA